MRRAVIFLLAVLFFVPFSSEGAIRKCIICHQKPGLKKVLPSGAEVSVYVDRKLLRASSHRRLKCQDCHIDVTIIPHKGLKIGRVHCERCHYHGAPKGVPQPDSIYQKYWNSVHGRKVKAGDPRAPWCQNCHGGHGVFPPDNPRSTVYKKNIPATCGKCHKKEYEEYRTSVHGVALLKKGIMAVPACVDCHGKHDVYSPGKPYSSVNPRKVPETCTKCHADQALMRKFKVSLNPAKTYKESFHGIALEFGELRAANCSSCHGVHNIYAPSDPRSTVNKANIPKTCGKCHPGANKNFAKGKIHLDVHSKSSGLVYYVAKFFIILTTGTMGVLFIHIFLDLYRKINEKREGMR